MSSLPLRDSWELFATPASVSAGAGGSAASSAPRLVGIAKLAREGGRIREGHQVEYFSLSTRSLLNRCTSARVPFTWTINPYRGCEFACKYCYARYTHEFMELGDLEFERKIYIKQQAAWLLRQELKKVKPQEEIALGTATDPYQPAEKRYEVTRSMLEVFAEQRGFHLGIVTKSDLVLRDLALLRQIASQNQLYVHLTVTTVDVALARILEPRAPRPDLRLQAVSQLAQSGIPAGVIIAPVMPGITDSPQALEAVVGATAVAGGMHVFANPLFLKPCSASVFLPFLEAEFPQLVSDYRQRYEGRAFVSSGYRKQIAARMSRLQQKYGFPLNRSKTGRGRDPIAARKYPMELAHDKNGSEGREKEVQTDHQSPLREAQLTLF